MTDRGYELTQGVCPHDKWEIRGHERTRPTLEASCARCGGEFPLSDLLNFWRAGMEKSVADAIARMQAAP